MRLLRVAAVVGGTTLLSGRLAAAQSTSCKSPKAIGSASDAEALAKGCSIIEGDLTISAGASGDDGIRLDGIKNITGGISIQDCPERCAGLTAGTISSSTLETVEGDIQISDVGGLHSLLFPALRDVHGSITLENLADLTSLDLGSLRSVNESFVLASAPELANLTAPPKGFDIAGDPARVRIWDVGLGSVDPFLVASSNAHTRDISVSRIPNIVYAELATSNGGTVRIEGNGHLTLGLGNFRNVSSSGGNGAGGQMLMPAHIETLNVSGLSAVRWSSSSDGNAQKRPGEYYTLGTLSVHDSALLTSLPMLWEGIGRLDIAHNDALAELAFPRDPDAARAVASSLRKIAVRDNPRLELEALSEDGKWNGTVETASWIWPTEDLETLVLSGVVHDTFFRPLEKIHGLTTSSSPNPAKPRVLDDFELTSTVPEFHCGTIDQMRMHGVFVGNYSCNGNSVDMVPPGSGSGAFRTRGEAFVGARNMFVVGVCVWSGMLGWGWFG
ncbi:hypothetical protein PG996_000218 [Apiospora saccharicola]|uniref:Uncharacterized protein n=1 Tax=Apiospora saccharicola TaxID=335842 RepID=A0ABR1WD47_9PEZI